VEAIHKRAGSWFADNELIDEALHHLLAAGETREAARTVTRHREDMLEKEQVPTLWRWVNMLPRNIIDKDPELLLVIAWSLWNQTLFPELKEVLVRVEGLLAEAPVKSAIARELQVECDVLRSIQHLFGEAFDPSLTLTYARQAIRRLPRHRYRWRGIAIICSAISYQMAGDLKSAHAVIFDALEERETHRTIFHTRLLIALCYVQLAEGDLRGLEQTARQQLDIALELDLLESIAYARFFLGVSFYLRNELTEAEEHLTAVVREKYKTSVPNFSRGAFALALTYQALGRELRTRSVPFGRSILYATTDEGQNFVGPGDDGEPATGRGVAFGIARFPHVHPQHPFPDRCADRASLDPPCPGGGTGCVRDADPGNSPGGTG